MLVQSSERRSLILFFVGPFPPDEESLWRLGVHCGLHSKSMAAPTLVTSGEYETGDRCQGAGRASIQVHRALFFGSAFGRDCVYSRSPDHRYSRECACADASRNRDCAGPVAEHLIQARTTPAENSGRQHPARLRFVWSGGRYPIIEKLNAHGRTDATDRRQACFNIPHNPQRQPRAQLTLPMISWSNTRIRSPSSWHGGRCANAGDLVLPTVSRYPRLDLRKAMHQYRIRMLALSFIDRDRGDFVSYVPRHHEPHEQFDPNLC